MLQRVQEDLQQKEAAFDQVEATLPTLILAQHLALLKTRNAFIDAIADLRHTKHVVRKCLKPWGDTTFQISQGAHNAIARLHRILEQVTMTSKGPASLKLVNIAQQATTQSQEVLPPLIIAFNTLGPVTSLSWGTFGTKYPMSCETSPILNTFDYI